MPREREKERERERERAQKLMEQLSVRFTLNHGGWRRRLVALNSQTHAHDDFVNILQR